MKFYRLSGATFYDGFNTIFKFIEPFLDDKMSIFEEYGAFNGKNLLQLDQILFLTRSPIGTGIHIPGRQIYFCCSSLPSKQASECL